MFFSAACYNVQSKEEDWMPNNCAACQLSLLKQEGILAGTRETFNGSAAVPKVMVEA